MKKYSLLLLLLLSVSFYCIGQDTEELQRIDDIERSLKSYAIDNPKIESKKVEISMKATLQEFTVAFTKECKINLMVDPSVQNQIVTTLYEASPRDILLHLCKTYKLELDFSGSIIYLKPFIPKFKNKVYKAPNITYNAFNKTLELDLNKDTLDVVLKQISQQSGKNVIAKGAVGNQIVGGFISKTAFDNALALLGVMNDLELEQLSDDDFVFSLMENENSANTKKENRRGRLKSSNQKEHKIPSVAKVEVKIDAKGKTRLDIAASDVEIGELLSQTSYAAKEKFYIATEVKGKITVVEKNILYEDFLRILLQNGEYTFEKKGGAYYIGSTKADKLGQATVVQLKHRSVEKIMESIPADLKTLVSVQEEIALNALVLSGTEDNIKKVKSFINQLDRPIPVVMIEMLILDVNDTRSTDIGIEAGIGAEPSQAGGTLFPFGAFTFSSGGVNNLLDVLENNTSINLGRVNPNFYMSLEAIETDGYVNVRQKPRLSTINGEEANLTNGETRYYLQRSSSAAGGVVNNNNNGVLYQYEQWKAVNADFSIKVKPVVSGDEQVTLEVEVQQSDFLGQPIDNAPPPTVNRTITSKIRVRNEEMVVLGGLESKSIEDSGKGAPLLSRIPVLKWLFSKRHNAKTKSKLLIFIKPVIRYQ